MVLAPLHAAELVREKPDPDLAAARAVDAAIRRSRFVRAYLAALNAWLDAGGPKAPPFVIALKDVALAELQENAPGLPYWSEKEQEARRRRR